MREDVSRTLRWLAAVQPHWQVTGSMPTPDPIEPRQAAVRLVAIKVVHTVVWAFFAGCIVAIPVLAGIGRLRHATILIAVTFLEVLVIILNDGSCPLTGVAARYTANRRDNFDIYLPEWLARNNKRIFGAIYVGGAILTACLWYAGRVG